MAVRSNEVGGSQGHGCCPARPTDTPQAVRRTSITRQAEEGTYMTALEEKQTYQRLDPARVARCDVGLGLVIEFELSFGRERLTQIGHQGNRPALCASSAGA